MESQSIFASAEVIGNVIGAGLSFLLGVVAAYVTQLWLDRRRRLQITYSKTIEIPLTLAKAELKDDLQITYRGNYVGNMYAFNLKIANTGRATIRHQIFTCLFSENTQAIEPFPKISTLPVREVGPIRLDDTVNDKHEFRYITLVSPKWTK